MKSYANQPSIKNGKLKIILVVLLAGLFLTACGSYESDNSSDIQSPPSQNQQVQAPTDNSNSIVSSNSEMIAVYKAQISYYETLIGELEEKLLSSREESFISESEYKSRIEQLEKSISELNKKLESANASLPGKQPDSTDKLDGVANTKPNGNGSSGNNSSENNSNNTNNNINNNEENRPSTEQLTSQSPYTYSEKDGKVTITCYTGDLAQIIIPETIDGKPVTAIGEGAFKNVSAERIVIPQGVTYVDWFAFSGCKYLYEITIPSSVTSIGYGAFDGCPDGMIIICPKNSYAASYAASWGIIAVRT